MCEVCKNLTINDLINNLKEVVHKANLMSPPFVDGTFQEINHIIIEIETRVKVEE